MLSPLSPTSLRSEVSPLAYDLLRKSLSDWEEDTGSISFPIDTHTLAKIDRYNMGGLSGYIEKKVREYVQCVLFWTVVGIINGTPVHIQMEYFRKDIIDGRDALVQFGDGEEFAIDVTIPREINRKIQKNIEVEGILERARKGLERTQFVEEVLWKLIIGIPYSLTNMVTRQLDSDSPLNLENIRSIIVGIIRNPQNDIYLDEIMIAGANEEWRKKVHELFSRK